MYARETFTFDTDLLARFLVDESLEIDAKTRHAEAMPAVIRNNLCKNMMKKGGRKTAATA